MAETQNRIIRPQKGKQEMFHATPADIAIYGGGAGGGKSFSLMLEPMRHINNPKFGGVIFRRTSTDIMKQGALWDDSFNLYPGANGEPNKSSLKWKFPSGATIGFGHMEHVKDRFKWQGSQMPLICLDELAHFEGQQFWYLVSRNRSRCGIRPYIRAATNPDPDSFVKDLIMWWLDENGEYADESKAGVVRWFIRMRDEMLWEDSEEAIYEKYGRGDEIRPMSFTFIPSKLSDNPLMTLGDPDYKAKLLALPYLERMQLEQGNWKIRPAAGNIFKREWFDIVPAMPAGCRLVRYWDRAATEPTPLNPNPDWTAGVLMGKGKDGRFYIAEPVHFQGTHGKVKSAILNTARQDGRSVTIGLEQEPGGSGKTEVADLIAMLAGFRAKPDPVSKDKVTRALPYSSQCEVGNVSLIAGEWNKRFIDEHVNFSGGDEKNDLVDGSSGAFNMLSTKQIDYSNFTQM